MLVIKRSAGFTPEVNLREHTSCTPLSSVNKAAHSGFETQWRHHQSPKHGYYWSHKRTCVYQKLLKQNIVEAVPNIMLYLLHIVF